MVYDFSSLHNLTKLIGKLHGFSEKLLVTSYIGYFC